MVENKEYTGGTPSVPSDDSGITPYPVVTPPISVEYKNKEVFSATPLTLCTAECIGVNYFVFTEIQVVGHPITFHLLLNGSHKAEYTVNQGGNAATFTLVGDTGTNIIQAVASGGNAEFFGNLTQTTSLGE